MQRSVQQIFSFFIIFRLLYIGICVNERALISCSILKKNSKNEFLSFTMTIIVADLARFGLAKIWLLSNFLVLSVIDSEVGNFSIFYKYPAFFLILSKFLSTVSESCVRIICYKDFSDFCVTIEA